MTRKYSFVIILVKQPEFVYKYNIFERQLHSEVTNSNNMKKWHEKRRV